MEFENLQLNMINTSVMINPILILLFESNQEDVLNHLHVFIILLGLT